MSVKQSFDGNSKKPVLGYLNKKEEIYYKRILWEGMHGKSTEEQSSEGTRMISSDSCGSKNSQFGLHGSKDSDMSYCKDDEGFGHHDGEMLNEYVDEYADDEYFGF
ncbi:hypothetical protein Sango_2237200 [Sesamum angolense]|uniref:Uncharacterized protein n=1 Tax=Sesamum angolense TaxID=2727404 RepID=A0AAE1W913_9LAMI|nr:hypothetical protein Sango_2237200 [Sesamum angolense]